MKKKISVAILLGVVLLSVLYVHESNRKITLTFGMFAGSNWDVPDSSSYQIFENAIQRFEDQNPNVQVDIVSGIVKEDYSEWLSQQILAGETPDVFITPSQDFSTFANIGVLQNLDFFMNKDSTFNQNDYYDSAYGAGTYKEEQYALPFESVPTLMFVNKTLLQKEGIPLPKNDWTWDDFYRICEQVSKDTDQDGKLDQFGVYGYTWEHAAFSNNVELFNSNGTAVLFDEQKMIDAVNHTKELTKLERKSVVASQDFDEGNVAFCPMQFSQYRVYKPYPWRVKKYSTFEWDCITLPAGPQGGNVSEVETMLVGISKTTKHKDEAWELLKMLCYDEMTQMDVFEYSTGVSALKRVTQSQEAIDEMANNNPGESTFEMQVLNDIMNYGKIQKRFINYETILSMLDSEIYRIINSESDVSLEMDVLKQKIESYMKE